MSIGIAISKFQQKNPSPKREGQIDIKDIKSAINKIIQAIEVRFVVLGLLVPT